MQNLHLGLINPDHQPKRNRKLEFKLFDVKHGFCAALMSQNYLTLIDCGHNFSDGFRPLQWLYDKGYRHIDSLVISNLDQDHISDIKAIRDYFTVGNLAVNPTVSSTTLRQIKIKGGPISEQMEILLKSMDNPELNSVYFVPYQTKEVNLEFYWVCYPYEEDTNNLSVVSFISFGTCDIIYPGDLEKKGWYRFLQDQNFRSRITKVNAFIASHHGRIDGYCKEVFDYCKPQIVIISDQERKFTTQEHDLYLKHATGMKFQSILHNTTTRKVMTTRNDGHLTIFERSGISYIKKGL